MVNAQALYAQWRESLVREGVVDEALPEQVSHLAASTRRAWEAVSVYANFAARDLIEQALLQERKAMRGEV